MEGKYEKLVVVGRGAYGVCWLCRRKGDMQGEKVIIKSIAMHGMKEKEEEAIKGEAKLLQTLQHPMIIGYYEHYTNDGSLDIVMQYAEGGTLEKLVSDQNGRYLPEPQVINYFAQIVLGLDYMHRRQVLHRDLKTQNILLNRKRNLIKLSDFGISKELTTRSVASTVIGTPNYLSPEICEGRAYNQKSDMWALGCILYELFELKRAFDGENLPAIVMKITKQAFTPLGSHVSEAAHKLVVLLLSGNVDKRPTAKELLTCPLVLPTTISLHLDIGIIAHSTEKMSRMRSGVSSTPSPSFALARGKRTSSIPSNVTLSVRRASGADERSRFVETRFRKKR